MTAPSPDLGASEHDHGEPDDIEQQAEIMARVHPDHWQFVSGVLGEMNRVTDAGSEIPCLTQDPREPAGQRYLDVCTSVGDLVATSIYCPDEECGGHPICRPCYTLALREGLVR